MYHRFKIGQAVAASGLPVPPGPYRITRLLPLADGMPQYRGQSLVDQHERVFAEDAIRPAQSPQKPGTRAAIGAKGRRKQASA